MYFYTSIKWFMALVLASEIMLSDRNNSNGDQDVARTIGSSKAQGMESGEGLQRTSFNNPMSSGSKPSTVIPRVEEMQRAVVKKNGRDSKTNMIQEEV